jgi:hypothetical protein
MAFTEIFQQAYYIYCTDFGRSRNIIYPAPNFCLHEGCLVAAGTGSPQGSGIVAWCPFWLWRADAQDVQGPGGAAGVVAAGGCGAGVPGQLEGPDGQVPDS